MVVVLRMRLMEGIVGGGLLVFGVPVSCVSLCVARARPTFFCFETKEVLGTDVL